MTGVSRNSSISENSTISSNLLDDLGARHAQNGAVEEDVLPSGEFLMKSGADLQEARDPAIDADSTLGGNGDAAQNFQQRALAGAVAADDADHFALLDAERNILQGPKVHLLQFFCPTAT